MYKYDIAICKKLSNKARIKKLSIIRMYNTAIFDIYINGAPRSIINNITSTQPSFE